MSLNRTKMHSDSPTPSRVTAAYIDGLPISGESPAEVLAEMERSINARETGRYISITNTESMYIGLRKPDHAEYIRNADFSLCDGVGVVLTGLAWGERIKRHHGPVLQLDCVEYGESRGWRHFFYGGKEGVADELERCLKLKYPKLNVVGTYCPPFRPLTPEEDDHVVQLINDAKPDILWVGLGLPKQEYWIAQHFGRFDVPWTVGVGAAFDYHSGNVPWAPAPFRALGIEWIFCFITQPRYRAKRYWRSGVYVVQEFLKGIFTLQFLGKPKAQLSMATPKPGNHSGE
jgi:N-acetylglucosaminyldiphosphoundecaprenol N-acetyl-beta-D-mannosaminyltransferase